MGTKTGNPRGRPKGAKSRRTKAREQQTEEAAKKIQAVLGEDAFDGDSHALLMAVYKDGRLPLSVRLDAAKAAIGFEKPRLSNIDANIDGTLGTYVAKPVPVEQRDPVESPAGTAVNGYSAAHS